MDELTRRRFLAVGVEAFAIAATDDALGRKPPAYPLNVAWVGAETARGVELMAKVPMIPGFSVSSKLDSAADVSSALSDSTVDAIVCTAPPERHAALAVAALKAGKSVYIEPPAFLSEGEAAAVESAAKGAKGIFFHGDRFAASTCYGPGIKAALDGAIGEVREARSWDSGDHFHVFDEFARKALGVDGEPEKRVSMLDSSGRGIVRMAFQGGRTFTIERTSPVASSLPYIDMPFASAVYGTKGAIVFAPNDRSLQFDAKGVLVDYWEGRDQDNVAFAGSLEVPLRNLDVRTLAHFAACVDDREIAPYSTLGDALAVFRRYRRYFA